MRENETILAGIQSNIFLDKCLAFYSLFLCISPYSPGADLEISEGRGARNFFLVAGDWGALSQQSEGRGGSDLPYPKNVEKPGEKIIIQN